MSRSSLPLALVTGGNKGIGFAICKQLLETNNFNVLLATRNLDNGKVALNNLKQAIPDLDTNAVDLIELDVSNKSSIRSAFDYLNREKKIPKLDVLINNAGIASDDEFNAKIVRKVFATNFYGAIDCTTTFLPLIQQATNGKILMMSSRVGSITKIPNDDIKEELNSNELTYDRLYEIMDLFINDINKMEAEGYLDAEGNLSKEDVKNYGSGWWNSAYGMSKLGLSQYSRILSRDNTNILPYHIWVGSYCPGFVRTDMTSNYGKHIPLGPDDGAKGMVKLANEYDPNKYENGKFWCLNGEELSIVDWYNCRIPRKRKENN